MSRQLAAEQRRSRRQPQGLGYQIGHFGCQPPTTWAPNVNAYETANAYLICVDLAGVAKEQIDIEVHEQRLTLRGQRRIEFPPEIGDITRLHLLEIDDGGFARDVELPIIVDTDQISADQHNGILWITLPKRSR